MEQETVSATFVDKMAKVNKNGQLGTLLFFKDKSGNKLVSYVNKPDFMPERTECVLEKDGDYWRYRDNATFESREAIKIELASKFFDHYTA